MLDIIIDYHRRKLEQMIEENIDYEIILKQSQILDEYINRKIEELLV